LVCGDSLNTVILFTWEYVYISDFTDWQYSQKDTQGFCGFH